MQLTGHGLDPSDPVVARSLADRDHAGLHRRIGPAGRRCAWSSSTRPRRRSASWATTPRPCATGCAPTSSCSWPWPHRRSRASSSATPAGPRSASSPSPTPTPSAPRRWSAANGPFATAVLNGDVDNYADLDRGRAGWRSPPEITTDAKVIPTLVSPRLADGRGPRGGLPGDRRRAGGLRRHRRRQPPRPRTGCSWPCAAADRRSTSAWPRTPSSSPREPYGVVEETSTLPAHGRRDAGRPGQPDRRAGARSSSWRPTAPAPSTGIRRWSYDGTELPVTEATCPTAQITTRDIDRGDVPALPAQGDHRRARVVPQDPAGQAGRGRDGMFRRGARSRDRCPPDGPRRPALGADRAGAGDRPGHRGGRRPEPGAPPDATARRDAGPRRGRCPATELSGFRLRADMSDTLVVAISQSGTTTDTNRTVDLVRSRGASVIAIVNRRNSDLTDKSDGVLYTSDGRDVEMSVASTKAFYAQVAAGLLLALRHRRRRARRPRHRRPDEQRRCSARCATLPDAHGARRWPASGRSPTLAARLRPGRRYWAIVGNGVEPDRAPGRSGSSCPSSATSRSPATPPRTRSTSTCPPSR